MISLAPVSVHQGRHYYQRDNYYTRDQHIENSRWYGKGAADLELSGPVKSHDFDRLLEGIDPLTGSSLRGPAERGNEARRAGLDLTFSAPKSVSLAALVGGDRRLELAHQRAVDAALRVVEDRYSTTRIGSGQTRRTEVAGNLVMAQFQHDTSRALDPQLHTHCVVVNAVKRNDGQWRSLTNESVYANSKFIGLIYQNELAKEVRSLGYDIRVSANDTFEIAGYSEAQLRVFSKRRAQIVDLGAETQKQARDLVKRNRPSKGSELPRSVLLGRWADEGESVGLTHPRARSVPLMAPRTLHSELVSKGAVHATERDVSFRRESLEAFALASSLGRVDLLQLDRQFRMAQLRGELLEHAPGRFSTEVALGTEQRALALLSAGRGRYAPIVPELPESVRSNEKGLNRGQQQALELTITTRDQFLAWQGVAGAGKTFAMKELKRVCESEGLSVRGFAPSAQAAQVLAGETGIEARTVASLLVAERAAKDSRGRELWIVDEAGLLSAAQAEELMGRANSAGARVVLVGDTRQLSSVEAGNPFKMLQQAGIATAYLTESRRQKTGHLKAAAAELARGSVARGLRLLDRDVVELRRESTRIRHVASEYIALNPSEREQTLVLAGTNRERELLTRAIREGLSSRGQLGLVATVSTLRARDLSREEARSGHKLRGGDVLVFHKDYKNIRSLPGMQVEVLAVNRTSGVVRGRRADGSEVSFLPTRYPAFQVYESVHREFAVGDLVRWTRNDQTRGLRNGQSLRVTSIYGSGIVLEGTGGRRIEVDRGERMHLDHDYVNTVYASQGKTCERVLISADRTFGQEALYVAVTRARSELRVYTESASRLRLRAEISRSKLSAVELLAGKQATTSTPQSIRAHKQRASMKL